MLKDARPAGIQQFLSSMFHAGPRSTTGRIQLRFTGETESLERILWPVRKIVDEIFRGMSKQFDEPYSATGRPRLRRSISCIQYAASGR